MRVATMMLGLCLLVGCSDPAGLSSEDDLSADARKKVDSGRDTSSVDSANDSAKADSPTAADSNAADSSAGDSAATSDSVVPNSGFGIAAAPPLSAYLRPGYVIVAKDRVYEGYTTTPFMLEDSSVTGIDANGRTVTVSWTDASVQKVLVGLTFRNAAAPAINAKYARNVLIYGCTFENLRSNMAGVDLHAINAGAGRGPVDDLSVVASRFNRIGADGIQWGPASSTLNYKWEVGYNEFYGPKDAPLTERWGENAWDVKGVIGPIHIHHNVVDGFRECLGPKRGGTQDCSGSPGTGAVIHAGEQSGIARNVTMDHNLFRDNRGTGALTVSQCDNVNIGPGHVFENNSSLDIYIGTDLATNVRVSRDQTKIDWTKVILGSATSY